MDLLEIEQRIEEIRALEKTDCEVAHGKEDELLHEFVAAVAHDNLGSYPVNCARAIHDYISNPSRGERHTA